MSQSSPVEWNLRNCCHLLRRTCDGFPEHELTTALDAGMDGVVASLLAPSSYSYARDRSYGAIDVLTQAKTKNTPAAVRKMIRQMVRDGGQELVNNWVLAMMRAPSPGDAFFQKMTFFWHGFFVVDIRKVRNPAIIIEYLGVLEDNALGNYGELMRSMVKNTAMLKYLDNQTNTAGNPNENLARELLELFSLGVGNYTEADIREGARALTGYTVRDNEYLFDAGKHDPGSKTILGKTGPWNADDFVDIILDQPACSRFVAGRMWKAFAGSEASDQVIDKLAGVFRQSGYEIPALVQSMLTEPGFYAPEVVGNKIKSPVEMLVSTSRHLNLDLMDPGLVRGFLKDTGQVPLHPPNVKGWPGGKAWINVSTLTSRLAFLRSLDNESVENIILNDEQSMMMSRTSQVALRPNRRGRIESRHFLDEPPESISETAQSMNRLLYPAPLEAEVIRKIVRKRSDTANTRETTRLAIDLISMPEFQVS